MSPTPLRLLQKALAGGSEVPAAADGWIPTAIRKHFLRLLDGTLPFSFHYQPIVDLRRAIVVGYEALARFPREIGLPPDQCIALATQHGIGPALECAIFSKALSARVHLPRNCFLTINVSPTFLLSEHWLQVLPALGNLDGIVVEITEQDQIQDYDEMRRRLEAIRALGASIAVDDMGSGYASLKHVMELKPNFVKLDRFFVDGCHRERSKAMFIEMIGTAAGHLDAWIIAEGVEAATELDELMRLGIPLAQGYYLGRPDAEMKALPADKSIHALAETTTLARYTDFCHTCNSRQEATALMAINGKLDLVAVVDQWNRPVEFIDRHTLADVRFLTHGMKAQLASLPVEVLQRALTRSLASRFDPIAVVDEFGTFRGAIRVDRLMTSVLESMKVQDAGI